MTRTIAVLVLVFLSSVVGVAVEPVPNGAKIFIAPMEGSLNSFIAAELIKRKVPITIVTDESVADYILAGSALEGDNKWFHTVFGGKDKHEGSVQLIDIESKTVVWAGEAGSRSLWMGGLKRGGMRKVAGRLAKQMKKNLFSK